MLLLWELQNLDDVACTSVGSTWALVLRKVCKHMRI